MAGKTRSVSHTGTPKKYWLRVGLNSKSKRRCGYCDYPIHADEKVVVIDEAHFHEACGKLYETNVQKHKKVLREIGVQEKKSGADY